MPSPLIGAERAIARLDENLKDPARRSRLLADAARREAVCLAEMTGVKVHGRDFLVGSVSVDQVEPALRQDVAFALALHRLIERLQSFQATCPPSNRSAASGFAAEAWRAIEEAEALLSEEATQAPEDAPDTGPAPWTEPWLDAILRHWMTGPLGRDAQSDVPWTQEILAELLSGIESDLRTGDGLFGAADAFRRIHGSERLEWPNPPRQNDPAGILRPVPPTASALALLLAPLLVRRATETERVWIPVSDAFRPDRTGFRLALQGKDDWRDWFALRISAQAKDEQNRMAELDRMLQSWHEHIPARRSASSEPALMEAIMASPAFTISALADKIGISFSGLRPMVTKLASHDRRVLIEVTQRGRDRIWMAKGLIP